MEEDENLEQNLDKSNEKLHISDVSCLVCDRCGYENTKEFIKYFDYCENCGLNMKQTCN
jgi:predicted Zn-ribbon and HTH transcriptional regulator